LLPADRKGNQLEPPEGFLEALQRSQQTLVNALEAMQRQRQEAANQRLEFVVKPEGKCLTGPEGVHAAYASVVSCVSLVTAGPTQLGMELNLTACHYCGAGLLTMAPFNGGVMEPLVLEIFGIAIPKQEQPSQGD
jgi:hypothetical protein